MFIQPCSFSPKALAIVVVAGLLMVTGGAYGASPVENTLKATSSAASAGKVTQAPEELCAPRPGDGAIICVEGMTQPPAPTGPEAASPFATAATVAAQALPGRNSIAAPVPCVGSGTDGHRLVAIYATAPGYPDRYATAAPSIRQWAGQASQEIWFASAGQSSGQTLRWATTVPKNGTCTPTVAKVVIPAASYATHTSVWTYLLANGYNEPTAHYIVWVESPPAGTACGYGQSSRDTRTDANLNDANTGTMFAWLTPPCWENGALHEVLHTLGAVSPTAPNATSSGHCTDGADLMCYPDSTAAVMTNACPVPMYLRQPLWGGVDCGRDSYYNQAPASGTYLATHWNVASSPFLQPTSAAPGLPTVASASGPRSALAGTSFKLTSGKRSAPAGARAGSPLWLAPAGCRVISPAAATTNAYCGWLTDGVKSFTAVGTDTYGRLGARTVKVSIVRAVNRKLTGTMTPSALTARAGTRLSVTLTVRDAATGRPMIGVPASLWGQHFDSTTAAKSASGTTNTSGSVRLSHVQPSVSVHLSATTAYYPAQWVAWTSRWVTINHA